MQIVSTVFKSMVLTSAIMLTACGINRPAVDKSEEVILQLNAQGKGAELSIKIEKGDSHNHPTFAIWAEDMDENFIQTLFVTKSIATGIYGHGPLEAEKWDTKPGWQRRPAALPYWIHKRNTSGNGPRLPDPEHPVPDAYTGATPPGNAMLNTRLDDDYAGRSIRILLEVNQPWDWNDFWTNDLYDDADYRTSCQPSLVYGVTIDLNQPEKEYYLNPVGHGHFAGQTGELYTDLSTITTARNIFNSIRVRIKKEY